MVRPGTYELLDEALAVGADIVGGLDPSSIDRDPKGSLDAIFALAVKHSKPIDIHLHEPGELGAFTLELIMERTQAEGLQGMVGVSHAFCLGMPDQARVAGLMARVAELDIRIFSNGSPKATCPSVQALRAAGVKIEIGCDGIRDTWGPCTARYAAPRPGSVGTKMPCGRDDELNLLIDTGRRVAEREAIGVKGHTLAVGAHARPDASRAGCKTPDMPWSRRHCAPCRVVKAGKVGRTCRRTLRGWDQKTMTLLRDLTLGERPNGRTALTAAWVLG